MKTLLKVLGVLALCFVALFALIVFGAKVSDAQAAVDAETKAARAKERAAEVAQAIAKRSIMVGMTTQETVLAWGEPQRKTVSGGVEGSTQLWHYEHGSMLVFREGLLVKWTQTK